MMFCNRLPRCLVALQDRGSIDLASVFSVKASIDLACRVGPIASVAVQQQARRAAAQENLTLVTSRDSKRIFTSQLPVKATRC